MYQVDWSETSTAIDLCEIYVEHVQHRAEIMHACKRIDKILAHSGPTAGTVISEEGLAKLQSEPLQVMYEFAENKIEIQTVKWIGLSST